MLEKLSVFSHMSSGKPGYHIDTAAKLRVGEPWKRDSISSMGMNFFFSFQYVQTGSETHLESY